MKRFFPLQIREADGEAACEAASTLGKKAGAATATKKKMDSERNQAQKGSVFFL
jgi:hypothetical protein